MEPHWDDLSEDEREQVKQAIDVLAGLYPLTYPRTARKAWLEWLRKMIEMRAPRVREAEASNH